MNLNAHWQRLLGFLPEGLLLTAGIIGIILILGFLGMWLWRGRQGANMNAKTFPVWPVFIGGILAAPAILVPVVLVVVDVILRVLVIIFETIASWF